PTLLFVNKTDRAGARPDGVLADVRRRLAPNALPLGTVEDPGTPDARTVPFSLDDPGFAARAAEALAEQDDALLAAVVDGLPPPPAAELAERLATQTARGLVTPFLSARPITAAASKRRPSPSTALPPPAGPGRREGNPPATV